MDQQQLPADSEVAMEIDASRDGLDYYVTTPQKVSLSPAPSTPHFSVTLLCTDSEHTHTHTHAHTHTHCYWMWLFACVMHIILWCIFHSASAPRHPRPCCAVCASLPPFLCCGHTVPIRLGTSRRFQLSSTSYEFLSVAVTCVSSLSGPER